MDAFATRHFTGRFVIGAHVRHPSHTVEQPGASHRPRRRLYRAHPGRTGTPAQLGDDGWIVFLATDQDRVVDRFRAEFGDRVACTSPMSAAPARSEDAAFDQPDVRRESPGWAWQLQHLVAARPGQPGRWRWPSEVVRDAWLMARCDMLLHVVSNVSTAVSYMNPELEMVFCTAA